MAAVATRRSLERNGGVSRVRRPIGLRLGARLVAAVSVAFMLGGCSAGSGTTNVDDPTSPAAPEDDATEKTNAGPVQERPIPVAGSAVVMRHDSAVPPGILDSVEETVRYAHVDFGDSGPLVVHVYGTPEAFVSAHEPRAQERARKDIEGGAFAFGGSGVIRLYSPTYAKSATNSRRLTLLHEYFHTVQASLSGPPKRDRPPLWLVEGSATYFELRAGANRGYTYFDRQREDQILKSKALGPLASYETEGATAARGGHGEAYTVGFVACDYLVETKGVETLKRDFWALLASTPDWQGAFAEAFGISINEFYVDFEAYRAKL